MTYPLELPVTDIVRWLKKRKDAHLNTVLFLGSRAGGLFRGKTLYSTIQYFSPRTFHNMTRVEQFGECYRVLHQEDFSRSDIDTILIASLQGLEASEADIALSELIITGMFETIISTNIDNLLTKALAQSGMQEGSDLQVFIPQINFLGDIVQPHSGTSCLLIKVFGDLAAGEYNLIRQDFYFDIHERLGTFLQTHLQTAMLMVGYDPFWDRAINAVLPTEGLEVWYINEKPVQSMLLPALQKREGKCIIGGEGSYEQFIQTLHWHLLKEKPVHEHTSWSLPKDLQQDIPLMLTIRKEQNTVSAGPPQPPPQIPPPVLSQDKKEQRRRVFIGYSQKDKKHFQQLQTHLARYEREKLVDIWNDTKIEAGTDWREETRKTLDITRVAILLVSAEFLASSFIAKNILPSLLQKAESGGAIILPVILNHCIIEDTPLGRFQPFNNLSKPLATLKLNDRHRVWTNLVRYVITLLKDA